MAKEKEKKKLSGTVRADFVFELTELINKYSLEGDSNTPDFILAEHLTLCLEQWNHTVQHRDKWYRVK
jgi:hypothetical protein